MTGSDKEGTRPVGPFMNVGNMALAPELTGHFQDIMETLSGKQDYPDLALLGERLGKRKINSVTGLFFDIAGPYTGLLAVYFMGSRTLFDHELELVTALGEQGAIALEKAIGYDQKTMDIYQKIVEGFALAIDARDRFTHGHSRRVARLSRLTARLFPPGF
jgi:hypothetical protein